MKRIGNPCWYILLFVFLLLPLKATAQGNFALVNYAQIDSLMTASILANQHYLDFVAVQDSIAQANLAFLQQTILAGQKFNQSSCMSVEDANNYLAYVAYLDSAFVRFTQHQEAARQQLSATWSNWVKTYLQKELYAISLEKQVDILLEEKMLLYAKEEVPNLTAELTALMQVNNEKFIGFVRKREAALKTMLAAYATPQDMKITINDFLNKQKKD